MWASERAYERPVDSLRRLILVMGVAGAVILAGLAAFVVIASIPPGAPGGCLCPVGRAFAVGDPRAGTCADGSTYASTGCVAGDFTYTLTVEQSTVAFGNVLFEVIIASNGSTVVAPTPGGFSVLTATGVPTLVAQSPQSRTLSMGSTFAYPGGVVNAQTPLPTGLYMILIDMGHGPGAAPDEGYALLATLTNGVSGFAGVPLP